ncbi:MAG: protein-export membrane protein SecD, partial [Myxococcota bacterium]
MSGSWWTRVVIIALTLMWGVWMLIPTALDDSAAQRNADLADAASGSGQVEDGAPEVAGPWYAGLLPSARLSLGLDLQGGIDLTLQVEVEEAVISSVQRDIDPLKKAAENEGIFLGDVRRARGEPAILIEQNEVSRGELEVFLSKRYDYYAYENTRTIDDKTYNVYRMTDEQAQYIRERAVEQALETLRSRIDETGVKEPSIVLKGDNRINIQLPGIEDPAAAIRAIDTAAVLQFQLVDEEAMKNIGDLERAIFSAEEALDPDDFADDATLSDYLSDRGDLPDSTMLLWEYGKNEEGEDARRDPYILKQSIILTGDDINDASVEMDQYNQPYTALEFKPRGGKIFGDVTGENVGRRFAIVLDDKIQSAPVIRERIAGGRAS